MKKTNIGLVTHSQQALNQKWFYMWGGYGQISTLEVIKNNIRQYSSNERWRTYLEGSIDVTRVCDCYGLVKSYLWWVDDYSNPKYNVLHDTNTAGAFNNAKEKGTLNTLPEVPGIILYMQGHVGVYIGDGYFIELMGNGVGAYKGKITNGVVTKGSKFTHWFKDLNIQYVEEERTEERIIEECKGECKNMYKTVKDVPNYARETVDRLMSNETLKGDLKGNINLTECMLRMMVINDRNGLYS